MSALIDTHVLLWHYLNAPDLNAAARACINNPTNVIYVSAATPWEIAIKLSTGKYRLHVPFEQFIEEAILDNGFRLLPVEPRHTARLVAMPFHHRDPFDRLLIAQALAESMPIVSADAAIDSYGVSRIW